MFRLFIQDIEKFQDLHESTFRSIHNLDKEDEARAEKFIQRTLRRVFRTEGFGTWPPLHPRYKAWKEEEYPGQTILRLEDDYYLAATRKGHPGNYLKRYDESDDFYSIAYQLNENWFETSTDKGFFYPALHEAEGGTDIHAPWLEAGSYHIPERPVFGLAEDDASLRSDVLKLYRLQVAKKLSNFHKGFGESVKGRKSITKAQRNVLVGSPEGIRGQGEDSLPF